MNLKTVLFVAGGTGGHLYPGIAAAQAVVNQPGWKAVFAIRKGDLGRELLQRENFELIEISGQGWPRRISFKMLTFPFKLGAGFIQAWAALGRLRPAIVVGMGGYLSFPVLTAARLRRIPTLIHEQNAYPGMANRRLSRIVDSVAISFPQSQKHFPPAKTWISGLPVRPAIGTISASDARRQLGLSEDRLTILIFGGSLGAKQINSAAVGTWPRLSDLTEKFQVLHITGKQNFVEIENQYKGQKVNAKIMAYCHDMAAALAVADLVICRAGGSTIAELSVARKPAILVPFPFASDNHQFYNSEVLVSRGVAELIPDSEFTVQKLTDRLRAFLRSPERLRQMQERYTTFTDPADPKAAAQRLADFITKR